MIYVWRYDEVRISAVLRAVVKLPACHFSSKLGRFWDECATHRIAMKRAANRPKDKLMVEEYIVLADEQKKLAAEEGGES